MMIIPKMTAADVEARVGTIWKNKNGCNLLLYKTARTDRRILNQVVGAVNWQSDFKDVGGTLFCGIGIRASALLPGVEADDAALSEWIWKWEAGAEPGTEKSEASVRIKGNASDAFKRAGFAWGIGEELYTSPTIMIKHDMVNDKYVKFKVTDLQVEDGEIKSVTIANEKTGEIVYPVRRDNYAAGSRRIADSTPPDDYYPTDPEPAQYYSDTAGNPFTDDIPLPFDDVEPQAMICSECGEEIKSAKVYKYSKEKLGRPLCYGCQKAGK